MSVSDKTYIVAEMACSHEGSPEHAKTIIDGAAAAGADAVQFQMWLLDDMVTPDHPDIELLTRLEMSRDTWRSLVEYVRANHPGLEIIACVYEEKTVDFATEVRVDAFKLHTSDLSNQRLVVKAASTGLPVHLSVGASTLGEIQDALEWIRTTGNAEITLMYGYQSFPTDPGNVHLSYLKTLKELFQLPVGYQDHTDAEELGAFTLPAAALGLGVDILEKHITHDRSFKGVDHEAALNPDEFRDFVAMTRELDRAMGEQVPRPFTEDELQYRVYSKKSIVAAKPIARGQVVSEECVTFRRAASLGLPPTFADKLIGKTATRDIGCMENIYEDDVS